MSKEKRNEQVAEIGDLIKNKAMVFIDYQGISVTDFEEIRKNLRQRDAVVKVLKNTLTLRALKQLNIDGEDVTNLFKKMTATAIADAEQFMGASKDILNAEKAKKVKIKGGVFNGEVIDGDMVRKYAKIPSQQELYGILVATLQQIISNFVFVLEEVANQKPAKATETKVEVESKVEADAKAESKIETNAKPEAEIKEEAKVETTDSVDSTDAEAKAE